MGCTVAMALLGICQFTFAGEPVSPHSLDRERNSPALAYQDLRAGGYPRHISDVPVVREPRRRGVIYVRPRG